MNLQKRSPSRYAIPKTSPLCGGVKSPAKNLETLQNQTSPINFPTTNFYNNFVTAVSSEIKSNTDFTFGNNWTELNRSSALTVSQQ